MATTESMIDTLNSLLRGEIAATETYQQAMNKIDNFSGAEELRQIHREHREAANTLRQHVHEAGGTPDQGSGTWGAFAKAVEGTAKLLGKRAALKALKEGEELGITAYEDALTQVYLPSDYQMLIRSTLLPQTRSHVTTLDQLISAQSSGQ